MGNHNLGALGVSINSQLHENITDQSLMRTMDFSKRPQKQIQFPCNIVQKKKNNSMDVIPANKNVQHDATDKILYRIDISGFSNLLFTKIQQSKQNKIWKYLPQNQSEQIKLGDLLKLGTLELQLILIIKNNVQTNSKGNILKKISQNTSDLVKVQNKQCRICSKLQQSTDNPLLYLCNCSGTTGYRHYQCARYLLVNRIEQFLNSNSSYFQVNPLKCEYCHQNIQLFSTKNNKTFQLLSKTDIGDSFAIFQIKNNNHSSSSNKLKKVCYYLINLHEGASLTLGRGIDCQIQTENLTVSRKHLSIFYLHKKLYMRDLKSRYGSLHFSSYMNYYFNVEEGTILWIKNKKMRISLYKDSWIPIQLPKTCCAASMNLNVQIFQNQGQKQFQTPSFNLNTDF